MTDVRQLKRDSILLLAAIISVFAILTLQNTESAYAADTGAGKGLLEQKCVLCHTLDRVTAKGATSPGESDWTALVDRMKAKGCPVTDQEAREIVSYLTTRYSKASAPVTSTAAPAAATTGTASASSSSAASSAVEGRETPKEQAQTGAEDWVFPLVGLGMIFSGFYLRRRAPDRT